MITDEGVVRQALALCRMKHTQWERQLEDKRIDTDERLKLLADFIEVQGKIKALEWFLNGE